jgi:hypothetical protein
LDTDIGHWEKFFRLFFFLICKLSKLFFWLVTFCVPEMILYPITFRYIVEVTNSTAKAGLLLPEVICRRRQRNSLNIQVTCLACVVQLAANFIFVVLLVLFFGESNFYGQLAALVNICFNFNLIPIFYIIMIDDEIKRSIFGRHSN